MRRYGPSGTSTGCSCSVSSRAVRWQRESVGMVSCDGDPSFVSNSASFMLSLQRSGFDTPPVGGSYAKVSPTLNNWSSLPSPNRNAKASPAASVSKGHESWRSFLADPPSESLGTQDIFLGPAAELSGDPMQFSDSQELTTPLGPRADFFVRRSSLTPSTDVAPVLRVALNGGAPHDRDASPVALDSPWRASRRRMSSSTHSDTASEQRSPLDLPVHAGAGTPMSPVGAVLDHERAMWPSSARRVTSPRPMPNPEGPPTPSPCRPALAMPHLRQGCRSSSESDLLDTKPPGSRRKAESMPHPGSDPSAQRMACGSSDELDESEDSDDDTRSLASAPESRAPVEVWESENVQQLPVDQRMMITTRPSYYSLSILMPGFPLDGITMTITGPYGRTLHIMANRWKADRCDSYERRITFGWDVQLSDIRAHFDDGYLKIEVPRKASASPTPSNLSSMDATLRDVPVIAVLPRCSKNVCPHV